MMITTVLIFVIICGILGVFLRRNYLNTSVSLLQVIVGVNALSALNKDTSIFQTFVIIFTIFIFIIFLYSLSVLLIKRRSSLQINEHTELRG